MAFVYEVNGQRVEFEREPTDADIDEAAKSLAPRPQVPSARPAPVEGSGGAAFGVYPQAGRRPEAQQDREASKEMALQTARGVVTGTLGAVPDILNIPGAVYGAVTGNEPGYRIPGGSEDINRILPGASDTPQARLARFGGEALSPVPALRTAQAVGRGTQAVGGAVKATAQAPFQATKGAFNAATGGETALAPLGKTYVTPEGAQLFREGKIDIATLESPQYTRPISELATGALDRAALKVAGNQIPLAGRGAQAFGERVMSDYIANPYKAAVDIGLPFITGGVVPPIYAMGRGLQAAADMRLAGKGFDPGLQQQVAAAKTQQMFQPPQAQAPRLPYNPTPPSGAVAPQTMYATQGGQASTNLPQAGRAALAEKYPAPAPVSPAQASQQMAAEKVQQTPVMTPAQEIARQAVLQKIQARAQANGAKYSAPVAQTPASVAPVIPTPAPVVKSAVPTKTPGVLKATEGRAAVESALASGEPATIRYKTSAGITTEDVNRPIKFKLDSDLELTRRINRPDRSNTLFGTSKSSGKPVKVEIADLTAPDSPEYIKVFDNSNPKSPVLIKTYDANGTMTSASKAAKKAPPGVSQMLTDDQAAMMNALKLPSNASALERKIATGTQATRNQLEAQLGKQLMDASVDRATKEIISGYMNLFDKYRNK